MRNSSATIKVNTPSQKVLLDTELLGQFSDGFWENSRNTSWKYLGSVVVAPTTPGVFFEDSIPYDYKKYSVNNKTLLDCVGDRMLAKARVANTLGISKLGRAEGLFETYTIESKLISGEEITADDINTTLEKWNATGQAYWLETASASFDFLNKHGLLEVVKALNNTNYDMKAMRKELKEITLILEHAVAL